MRGDTLNSLEGLDCISHSALQHIEPPPPKEDLGSMSGWKGVLWNTLLTSLQSSPRIPKDNKWKRNAAVVLRNDHQTWFDSCR